MFEGFSLETISLSDVSVNLRYAGDGPPLVLLHGYPQTHIAWHLVAPVLAEHFTVYIPDLRGYGDSSAPVPDSKHNAYSKRSMAHDVTELMDYFGHDLFRIAGHDRGGRVAYRLALDTPERVLQVAVLDIVPGLEMYNAVDKSLSYLCYHWFFLSQPSGLPEKLINSNPDYYVDSIFSTWLGESNSIAPEAMQEYYRCFRKESVVNASCEDYRSGYFVDPQHDLADLNAGKKIQCPILSLTGRRDENALNAHAEIWKKWADDVTVAALNCGHFLMEEDPKATSNQLLGFFK